MGQVFFHHLGLKHEATWSSSSEKLLCVSAKRKNPELSVHGCRLSLFQQGANVNMSGKKLQDGRQKENKNGEKRRGSAASASARLEPGHKRGFGNEGWCRRTVIKILLLFFISELDFLRSTVWIWRKSLSVLGSDLNCG